MVVRCGRSARPGFHPYWAGGVDAQRRRGSSAGLYATGLKFMELALMPLVFMGLAIYPRLSRLSGSNDDALLHASSQFPRGCEHDHRCSDLGSLLRGPARPRAIAGTALCIDGARVAHAHRTCDRSGRGDRARAPAARDGSCRYPVSRIIAVGTLLNIALMVVMVTDWHITGAVAAGIVALAAVDVGYALPLAARCDRSSCGASAVRWPA